MLIPDDIESDRKSGDRTSSEREVILRYYRGSRISSIGPRQLAKAMAGAVPSRKTGLGLTFVMRRSGPLSNGRSSHFFLDLAKPLPFRAKLVSELECATGARLIRIQPAPGLGQSAAILPLLFVKAIKSMLQP